MIAMEAGLKIFEKPEFGSVRVVEKDGDPWFVAKDVCEALELDNVGQALSSLDDDEKNTIIINDGIPGNPNRAIVSEPGIYSLILRSRKPEAKAFKRWLVHDVIPTIRKTGSYGNGILMPNFTDPLAAAEAWIVTERARRFLGFWMSLWIAGSCISRSAKSYPQSPRGWGSKLKASPALNIHKE